MLRNYTDKTSGVSMLRSPSFLRSTNSQDISTDRVYRCLGNDEIRSGSNCCSGDPLRGTCRHSTPDQTARTICCPGSAGSAAP